MDSWPRGGCGVAAGSLLARRLQDAEVKVVFTDVLSVTSCTQVLLLSQDYGKHLLGVEDLLQKHALVEADIGIQAERVRGVNASAQKFAADGEGEDGPFHTLPASHPDLPLEK